MDSPLILVMYLNSSALTKKVSNLKRVRLISKKSTPKVKRTFYASPSFLRVNANEIMVARRLISVNLEKLKKGKVVDENGFVIKKDLTGETRPGKFNEVTLSVTHNRKVCFVKIGGHSGELNAKGYERARKYVDSINNEFKGFKVHLVPAHIFYEKQINGKSRGIAVSDFFPKESGELLHDILLNMGEEKFNHSKIGQVFWELEAKMFSKEILDGKTYNCFYDRKSKSFYFFDLI